MKKIINKITKHFINVIKRKTSPHSIALGFAIGTFICILPILGFHIPLLLLLILLYPKINKVSVISAAIVWNPIVAITIQSTLGLKIGSTILGTNITPSLNNGFLNMLYTTSKSIIIGSLILAVILGLFSYLIVRICTQIYQHRKKEKEIRANKYINKTKNYQKHVNKKKKVIK